MNNMDKELNKVLSKLEGRHGQRLNRKLDMPEEIKKELEDHHEAIRREEIRQKKAKHEN